MYTIENITINNCQQPTAVRGDIQVRWKLLSDSRNVVQQSYRIQIALDKEFMKLVYDSGDVESEESANVVIRQIEWVSLQQYFIRCRSISNEKDDTGWSEISTFVTAIQSETEFQGNFISAENKLAAELSGGTYLRKQFMVRNKAIVSAYIVSTALGLYDLSINGKKVGTDELKPGWTSYHKRLLYQVYDVRNYLTQSENVIGAMVGAGWYKGRMGFLLERNNYGTQTAFYCMLQIRYDDGSVSYIYTDESWKGEDAPITFAEIYDGEIYDACKEQDGWNMPGFCDKAWRDVEIVDYQMSTLVPQSCGTVKKIMQLKPKKIFQTPRGETVLDFGQNLTGWIACKVCGQKNDVAKLKHFEVLDKDGNVYLDNLRTAKQEFTIILKDSKERVFQPHFTYMGFRYLYIEQFPGAVSMENFTAYVIHTNMEETGMFECSNPLVNQLFHNIKWGMRGNFLDIPTDCPQRDERCGWTGDAQIFSRTASFLMNTDTFFEKWLSDLAADQTDEGGVPHIVPDILTNAKNNENWLVAEGTHSAAAWADAAVVIPWNMYLAFGDREILKKQYFSMKAWIDFMISHGEHGMWTYGVQLGDWLALDAQEGSYYGATPNAFVCLVYFIYSCGLFSKIAGITENREDELKYLKIQQDAYNTFREQFVTKMGKLTVNTQTAYILALNFQLLPAQYNEQAVQELLRLLKEQDGHLVTGFVGTPYFCNVLSQYGHDKEAYELILQEDYPSWLYQVKAGATTIWEHWDGIKPDGSMWSADMNSFNHYAYGAVGEWLFRFCAGLEIDEKQPGYKHILICPHVGVFSFVNLSYDSVYGKILLSWTKEKQMMQLKVQIPVNTTATITLDNCSQIIQEDGICFIEKKHQMIGNAGSGCYTVKYLLKTTADIFYQTGGTMND